MNYGVTSHIRVKDLFEDITARRYALYTPTIGKRRPGRPRTSYLNYVQRLLGIIKEQCKNSRLPHLLMMVVHGETLWSPAPQPMDDDDDDDVMMMMMMMMMMMT